MTRRLSLLNQVFKPLQAETAHIDLAFAVDDLFRKRRGVATYSVRGSSTTSRKVSDLTLLYSLATCRRQ